MNGYLSFARRHRRHLGFGLLLWFGSSPGQTFFIGLFAAAMREDFGLTLGNFGDLYLIATVSSAVMLALLGRLADTASLRLCALVALGGLAAASAVMASATGVVVVTLALFGLRFTGQGLLPHIGTVAMVRHFAAARGRALAVTALGLPLGEGVLPLVALALIGALGWREAWLVTAAFVGFVLLPAALWLLAERGGPVPEAAAVGGARPVRDGADRTRSEVLHDVRFWMLLGATMCFPFLTTGTLFYQTYIAAAKGWPLALMAAGLATFAVSRVVMSLVTGPLIDRLSARRLLVWMYLPYALSFAALAAFDHPAGGLVSYVLHGVAFGMLIPISGAVWPELYGTRHVGSIRSLWIAASVAGSALAPSAFGHAFDGGVGVGTVALAAIGLCVASGLLAALAVRLSAPMTR